ncbi:TPA: 30S ribosomal protein S4 [archaeon]|uniref:Small ribosomal subunit protein uS4 n=1 Tax=Candidatus Undinarchaeum marinum TaxID=2756141 RepID=A0A832XHU3_9ARCH|nr:30S ribosomal protein S4 [Candidatus Undinarchaeum marinum]
MGDPVKTRKKYSTPSHMWIQERITRETKLSGKYGLKKRQEIWRAESLVKKFRSLARQIAGIRGDSSAEQERLLGKLLRMGVIGSDSKLNDILTLDATDFLERRLQTIVLKKGLASTAKEARQIVLHGFVTIDGERRRVPGSLLSVNEEDSIAYVGPSREQTVQKPTRALEAAADEKEDKSRDDKALEEKPKEVVEEKPKEVVEEKTKSSPAEEKKGDSS